MTVQTTENRINQNADGVKVQFDFNFQANDPTHIKAYFNGVEQTTGFTVNLNADQNASPGGNVTFATAPPLTDPVTIVTVQRIVPNTQPVDWTPYDEFPAEVLERSQDDDVFRAQQLQDESDRALKAGVSTPPGVSYELPTPEANRGLYWNPTADGFANGPTVVEIEADKNAAQAAATEANASAGNAATSENNALTHANNSLTYANNSQASAVAASNSQNKAQQWAENPEDTEVEPGKFSALHWAAKAQKVTAKVDFVDIVGGVAGTPTKDAVITTLKTARTFQFPINMAGSQVNIGTNPAATIIFSLRKNGVEFGTMSITDAGAVTFAAAAVTSFAIGDVFTVVAPSDLQNIRDLYYTLTGDLT